MLRTEGLWLASLVFLFTSGLQAAGGQTSSPSTRWQLLPDSPAGTRALAVANDSVYAGTPRGLFVSRSADGTWKYLSDLNVEQLVVTPGSASKIYAIADVRRGPTYLSSWLYQTSDAGDSWTVLRLDTRSFVVDPFVPDTAYAALYPVLGLASGGVEKTSDAGGTWTLLPQDFACVKPQPSYCYLIATLAINPSNPLELYAFEGHEYILYKSRDGGMTWSPRYSGAGYADLIVVDPLSPLNVYARWHTFLPDTPQLLRTTDGGQTWTLVSIDRYAAGPLAIDPGTGDIFLATRDGLLRSDDHGEHWVDVSGGLAGLPVSSLAFSGDGSLYAATGTGIFVLPLVERSTRSHPETRVVSPR